MLAFTLFLSIVGSLTLIVGGIGVSNIMNVVVEERTKEIGIKMALGAKPNYILFQFLSESLIITIVGGIIGIVFSIVICTFFSKMGFEQYIGIPRITIPIAVVTTFVVGLIGVISGYFPAREASLKEPVIAMKFEVKMNKEELKIILTLFFSSAFLRKKRAILTIAAISWGTVAILLLLAFGNGLQKRMVKARNGMGENIAVVWPGETSMSYQGLKEGRRIIFRVEDIPFVRERIPQFDSVSGEMCNWSTTLTYKSKTLTLLVTGVNWEYGEMRNLIPQKGGRFFNANDEREKRRVIFIGNDRAKELFGNEDGVGKEVLLNDTPYTVIGILKINFRWVHITLLTLTSALFPSQHLYLNLGKRR